MTAGGGRSAVRFESVSKRFGGTAALDDVSFDVAAGSVHALLGGNGSGKSTLIKILSGVYQADSGWIEYNGARHSAHRTTPELAKAANMHFVHQAVGTFGNMTVADNFALSSGYDARTYAPVSKRRLYKNVAATLERFELDISPARRMSELPGATQMMVAVARALDARHDEGNSILVLDEPTAALPSEEEHILLGAIRSYRRRGHTVILVTHRLDEVAAVADVVTFLRDGRHLETADADKINEQVMVSRIAGMEQIVTSHAPRPPSGVERLVITDLSVGPLDNVSMRADRGEIVGLSGLLGSGRSNLLRALFGRDQIRTGSVTVDGKLFRGKDAVDALSHGIAYVSADRQGEGMFPDRPIRENLSLANLRRYWRGGMLSAAAERRAARAAVAKFGVVASSPEAAMSSMSGGNQQKVVLARWMELKPRLLLLNEPTQGVDVGARAAIHQIIRDAADDGTTVLVASSDPRELAELCDRVIGFYQGRLSGEVRQPDLSAGRCIELAFGRDSREPSD